jgi:cell division protease FtsH
MSAEELTNKIAVLLGGRAAEELVFNQISTGAADDIAKATNIARSMVSRYGMHKDLGYVAYDTDKPSFLGTFEMEGRSPVMSEQTAREIDLAVREIIHQSFELARRILTENREILDRCAKELLKDETLNESRLAELTVDLE